MNRSQIGRLFIIILTAVLLLGVVVLSFSWYSEHTSAPNTLDILQQSNTDYGFAIDNITVMYPSSLRPYQTAEVGQRGLSGDPTLVWDSLQVESGADNLPNSNLTKQYRYVFDGLKVYEGANMVADIQVTTPDASTTEVSVTEYNGTNPTPIASAIISNDGSNIAYKNWAGGTVDYLYNNYLYLALNVVVKSVGNTVKNTATDTELTNRTLTGAGGTALNTKTLAVLHRNELEVETGGATGISIDVGYQLSFAVMDDLMEQALVGKTVKFSLKMTDIT